MAFDHDVDRGSATVTVTLRSADNVPIIDGRTGGAAIATFRTWVQMVKKGQSVTCAKQGDLVINPFRKSLDDEEFVLWSEVESAAELMRQAGEKMVAEGVR